MLQHVVYVVPLAEFYLLPLVIFAEKHTVAILPTFSAAMGRVWQSASATFALLVQVTASYVSHPYACIPIVCLLYARITAC